MNRYDDMPREWVHPKTMAFIRMVVLTAFFLLVGFFGVMAVMP